MKLKSKDFKEGGFIPQKHSYKFENIMPDLEFIDMPNEAKSLVLIIKDLDSPFKEWTHLICWNIPKSVNGIKNGKFPSCVIGMNDFKEKGYGGPNPPFGKHRYSFNLYALAVEKLDLNENIKRIELEEHIEDLIVDKCELIGLYEKKLFGNLFKK